MILKFLNRLRRQSKNMGSFYGTLYSAQADMIKSASSYFKYDVN